MTSNIEGEALRDLLEAVQSGAGISAAIVDGKLLIGGALDDEFLVVQTIGFLLGTFMDAGRVEQIAKLVLEVVRDPGTQH